MSGIQTRAGKKQRLQFDFGRKALRELDSLKDAMLFPTRAELIRHALWFLGWAWKEINENGASLMLERNGEKIRIVLPSLTKSQVFERAEPIHEEAVEESIEHSSAG
jgi:hypothetical protein